MNKLTVIIPFLNEGIEVENTLNSIRTTARNNVDILLINDNSTDDFDYRSVADKYSAAYIKNGERKGVAQSRDIGVSKITTPYFILLDAHMRFYQDDWWKKVLEYIEGDDRAVYCLKCIALTDKAEKVYNYDRAGYGAYINLFGYNLDSIIEPSWIKIKNSKHKLTNIPCVLGASYVMSKRYWDYLKGLSMLRYYGADEAYLSLKIWLEGGSCKVINDIEAGHIFRTKPPFQLMRPDSIYNKLLIAETILPEDYAQYVHTSMRSMFFNDYFLAVSLLNKNRKEILSLKKYYQSIFTKDFIFFKDINRKYLNLQDKFIKITSKNIDFLIKNKLDEIAQFLSKELTKSSGLMTGGIGEIIFLCEYAKQNNKSEIQQLVKDQLSTIINQEDINYCNLRIGAAGLGVGLQYLANNKFIDFDLNGMFEDIDENIYTNMINEIDKQNFNFLDGATGLGYYFLNTGNDKHTAYIKRLVTEIEKHLVTIPDIGVGGVLDLLQFLLLVHKKGILTEDVSKVVRTICNYILLQIQDYKKTESYFPKISVPPSKIGFIWGIGDLTIGYLLLQSSIILQDQALYNKSIEILTSTTRKKDTVIEQVNDASLSQGSSGIAFLYNKLYQQTNSILFKRASDYWLKETFYKSIKGENFAGYSTYGPYSKEDNLGLLNGIAGIGLSMLACTIKPNFVDTFFMQ